MDDVLALADRLWRGQAAIDDHHPLLGAGMALVEVAPGIAFLPTFGTVTAITTAEGLVLVDTGSALVAEAVHGAIRAWSGAPVVTAVYTHGHIDHVFGLGLFEAEAARRGDPPIRVLAHERVPARFDRYRLTAGYNAVINRRQFGIDDLQWPTEYRYPDQTYSDELEVEVGGVRLKLHHARGETDDATWVWLPDQRVLCSGDLVIWATPNAGNPQKVQRYPAEWAQALRAMAACDAEVLLPGHGLPIIGANRVRATLTDAAALLEHLVEATLELMNAGADLDEILQRVRAPEALLAKPYLQPVYDEPEFIVRTVWRRYGGWYEGDPSQLKPAPRAALAAEVARLAGGARRLTDRATELATDGDLRLAAHLVELAHRAAPDDPDVHAARAEIYERRAAQERSTMARGVFSAAARDSRGV